MKLKNIHGKEVVVDISKEKSPAKPNTRQAFVVSIVEEFFPFEKMLENFYIPGSRMSLDIFMPSLMIGFEIQGEQHDEYIPFFHGNINKQKYVGQVKRDIKKANWCSINKITLIEIFPKESEDVIRRKIVESSTKGRARNIIGYRKNQ